MTGRLTRVVTHGHMGAINAFVVSWGHDVVFRMYENSGFHAQDREPDLSGPLPLFCVGTVLAMLGESRR